MFGSRHHVGFLVDTAKTVFGPQYSPFFNVPLPLPLNQSQRKGRGSFEVAALWTKDGLRPRWGNLAIVIDDKSQAHRADLHWWQEVMEDLQIPLTVLASHNEYTFFERLETSRVASREVPSASLRNELERYRPELFSPRSLSALRPGQLSLADLEDSFADHTFSNHFRHKAQLEAALRDGLTGALRSQMQLLEKQRREIVERDLTALVTVSIAYLAARILEDKGLLKGDGQATNTNDPRQLLDRVLEKTNGFFQMAAKDIHRLDETVLQQLALHMGYSVTFSLVDHKDVGSLYEHAVRIFQSLRNEFIPQQGLQIANLQQHYTPQAIADRMLDMLPLERIRPEERVIFDPAAGSGSLLLAATRRLTLMPDVHLLNSKKDYLSRNVMGNDLDEHARLVTKLRYSLAQEAFGVEDLFPDPEYYGHADYHKPDAWNLPLRPRIVVANPPFAEENATQRAVRFIKEVMARLREGDQFAIVLPQTFLTGTTHGWSDARRLVTSECRIIETWQLPEGSVGLAARQPVCFVLGTKTSASKSIAVSRAIVSGAQMDLIRERGFLGQSWIVQTPEVTDDWRDIVAPGVKLEKNTVELGELFYICTGVGPKKGVGPLSVRTGDVPVKLYWKNKWRKAGSIWANPNQVPTDARYIRFDKEYLEGHRSNKAPVFDTEKLLVGRIINRNSREPLAVSIDTTGLCPDKNVFCLLPYEALTAFGGFSKETSHSINREVPQGWTSLEARQKLLWLLGVLSSDVAIDIFLPFRDARHINSKKLGEFPLPELIDWRIIDAMETLLRDEQKGQLAAKGDIIWRMVNKVVEESYGVSKWWSLIRTGRSDELESWLREQEEPVETVTGQVVEVDLAANRVKIYLEGLLDEELEAWIPLPPEMPGWALDGTVFEAELSHTVQTFQELSLRPSAFRHFKHTPRPYLTMADLQDRLLTDIDLGV